MHNVWLRVKFLKFIGHDKLEHNNGNFIFKFGLRQKTRITFLTSLFVKNFSDYILKYSFHIFFTGTLGKVHLSCLERWLNMCERQHCEICRYQFEAKRKRRYTICQAIR